MAFSNFKTLQEVLQLYKIRVQESEFVQPLTPPEVKHD